ncbi:MAG: RES domain-containing protein [Iamia sp.]
MIAPGERTWYRGGSSLRPADDLVPGRGDTRFAPLPGTRHLYIGATRTVVLLETALHEASGPDPAIYAVALEDRQITPVELTEPLRFADLRDPELARLGIDRAGLVDTTPLHYPCTRVWAGALQHHRAGGRAVVGALWHSRQADLHARANPDGLVADLVRHQPAEVAVLWHPEGPAAPVVVTGPSEPLVVDHGVSRLVVELSALIGAPIE